MYLQRMLIAQTNGAMRGSVVLAERPMDRHVTNTLVAIAVFYTICFTPLCLYNTAHLIKVFSYLFIQLSLLTKIMKLEE